MRASFGGAADLSQQLAIFYNQFQDRLTELTQRAANRAEDEEAATDQDKINAWQSGDISDKDIIAYLQGRISDSTNDPKVETQLKDALRSVQDSIAQQGIADTAQDIIDGIQSGKRTWNDLRDFYAKQRKKYRPNDPIYKQITDQINQVNDRIRDNDISGGVERVQYLFQNKQLTGKQAGAQLRKLAAAYKNEDPAKYYQLLQSAVQLEQFGGGYYASGGGSRSGGGSGGSSGGAKNLNGLIDSYQAMRNALLSQSQQFEDGHRIGYDSDGNSYLLMNDDGTPSAQMQAIDQQALDTYDLLTEAYREKGDFSAAEGAAADKQQYIADHIQPRNTIGPEQQRTALLDGIAKQVQIAVDGNDPVGAASVVRRSLDTYRKWVENLNSTKTFRAVNKVEGTDVGNPEGRKGLDVTQQTTADFVKESSGIYDAIEQAIASGDPNAVAGISIPDGLSAQLRPLLENSAGLSQVLNGLQDGSWVWVMDQNGIHPNPTVTDLQGNRVPIAPNGQPLVPDASALTPIATTSGGKPIVAFAVGQKASVWNGPEVIDAATGKVVVAPGQVLTDADISALRTASGQDKFTNVVDVDGGLSEVTQVIGRDEDGNLQQWFGRKTDQGMVWTKDKIDSRPTAARPAPIIADDPFIQQRIANDLGLDPTGRAYSGFNSQKVAQASSQMKQAGITGSLAGGTTPQPVERRGGFQQSVEPGTSQYNLLNNGASSGSLGPNPMFNFGNQPQQRGVGGSFDQLDQMNQRLGINLRPQPKSITRGGFFQNADQSTALPSVGRGSLPSIRKGGFFQGANTPDIAPVRIAPLHIRPVNLNFDLPEPENIYNPIPTATGRKGGKLK